jgi:arylsulfatase A-like enzyme
MGAREPAAIPVRVIVGDLLSQMPPWEVLEQHGRHAPVAGVITPSDDYRLDGADMPALVLPPPARVRFRVPAELAAACFHARAGVDQSGFRRKSRGTKDASVRLRVEVDGERVFERVVAVGVGSEPVGWESVGGDEGLELRGGQEVVLATALVDAQGAELAGRGTLMVGFGGCWLEETRWRPRAPSSPERPNVVLVLMDTERADRLSTYGYARETSPRLTELAERGLLFEAAQSTASWTWPSTASILTGLLPEEHGVLNDSSCYLAHGLVTLAEAFQREGATTAAWSANPLVVPEKNFDQGFERFDHAGGFRKSEEFLNDVEEFLEEVGDRRFFLYLHLADPHDPLLPVEEARRALAAEVPKGLERRLSGLNTPFLKGAAFTPDGRIDLEQALSAEEREHLHQLYDACVRTGDIALGRVLDALDRHGLRETTVVAYTADHGEELFDHGLVQHGSSLYQESVRVPLVIAGPGVPVGRVADPVSNRHLAPTLARLARAELAPGGTDAGAIDLLEASRSSAAEPEVLFSTTHGWWNGTFRQPIYGLRSGSHVLHWAPEGLPWGVKRGSSGVVPGERRLFDLAEDPLEQRDLAVEDPERADLLQARLQALIDALEDRRSTPALEAGSATLEMLRDVGYLDGVDDE